MGIKDVLKAIGDALSKPFSDIGTRSISEDSIRAQLEDTKWALVNTLNIYNAIGLQTFNVLHDRVRLKIKKDPAVSKLLGGKLIGFISDLDKKLKGSAQRFGLHRSITTSLSNMIKVIDKFDNDLPTIIGDGIIVSNLTVSQSILLGTIESINVFRSSCDYLFAILSHTISNTSSTHIQKYMGEYLIDNNETFFNMINRMVESASIDDSVSAIRGIRSAGLDVAFAVGGKNNVLPIIAAMGTLKFWLWAAPALFAFFVSMGGITYIGEIYIDIRHHYYERLKDQKLWLEAHLANIKLILSDMDPNDPEYLKLQKAVEYYNDKIASLDKKINSYYDK